MSELRFLQLFHEGDNAYEDGLHTLIPFMEYLKRYGVKNICVDSRFESEENYSRFEENGNM